MNKIGVSPYLLLVLTTLFWSGNFVLARFVRRNVPPIGLSFWSWTLAATLLLPFIWRDMRRIWLLARRHLGLIMVPAMPGVTNFDTFYLSGAADHHRLQCGAVAG